MSELAHEVSLKDVAEPVARAAAWSSLTAAVLALVIATLKNLRGHA
jgi:hypothetical protein